MIVLVIDDDSGVRKSLSHILASKGHQVLEADSGEKGFDVAARKKIDLILTDYKMPGWTGVDLVRSIEMVIPDTPVIVISAYFDEALEETLRAIPIVKALIDKPFSMQVLLEAVEKHGQPASPG